MNRSGVLTLILIGLAASAGAQTKPIQPNIQETPMPPPVAIPPPSHTVDDVNHPLSASEAAKIAIRYQKSLAVSAAALLSARGKRQEAFGPLTPQLSATGAITQSEQLRSRSGSSASSVGPSAGASATLSQLIFDFNRTRNLARQADALEGVARQNFTSAQSDLVLQVKQAYYTLVQNANLVKVSEANLLNRNSQVALARARVQQGLGQPADLVQAETSLSDAQQSLVQARASKTSSEIALALLMGIDPRTPILTADSREPVAKEDDLTALVAQGLKQRPEMLGADFNVAAARFGYSANRSLDSPALTLSVIVSGKGRNDPTSSETGAAQLGLTWTLLDGGVKAGKIKEAQAALDSALASQTVTRNQVLSDVSQAYLSLKSAEQRKTITAAQVVNAKEGVRIAQGRYEAGLGTFIDVTTAQALLVTAETNDVNADASLDLARASLARAIGQPAG